MKAEQFKKWRAAHSLTIAGAAAALGISPRMVGYYQSGEQEVPKTVHLAMMAHDLAAEVDRMGPEALTPKVRRLADQIRTQTS